MACYGCGLYKKIKTAENPNQKIHIYRERHGSTSKTGRSYGNFYL